MPLNLCGRLIELPQWDYHNSQIHANNQKNYDNYTAQKFYLFRNISFQKIPKSFSLKNFFL